MNTTSNILVTAAAIAALSFISPAVAENTAAPTVGGTILGVEVNVAAVEAKGFRASKLIGATVYNDKKKAIGTVNDLIVSSEGQVNLAIIDVGGFLGLGAKHVAIPTKLFERGNNNTVVLPKATEKDLKAMPPFRYAG